VGKQGTEAPRRGRPRTIDQERIVAGAIELGLDGFTMSGLAAHLGVSTPSLYTHVTGRDEVLALVGAVLRERVATIDSPAETWRGWLTDFALAVRTHLAPSAATVLVDLASPGMIDRVGIAERGLQLLIADGFTPTEAGQAVWLVFRLAITAGPDAEPSYAGFVRGATPVLAPPRRSRRPPADLPATRAVHQALVDAGDPPPHDPFAFDLAVVLDGIDRQRRPSTTRSDPP
jgi:TetR/AcrR family transcriptional regulator, tetracycline repressor protein